MKYLISILAGYLVGTVNPSYLIAKCKGFDIRKSGSNNAGGSNALITMGKLVGLVCILFDIGKAFGVVRLMVWLFPENPIVFACTAVACILGHIFPFYLRFKGGKGLACLGGSILAYNPVVFLWMLLGAVLVVLITDYICFVPMSVSVAFPIVYGVQTGDIWGALLFLPVIAAIYWKHYENLLRIRQGQELHVSFLWRKDKEIERVRANFEK